MMILISFEKTILLSGVMVVKTAGKTNTQRKPDKKQRKTKQIQENDGGFLFLFTAHELRVAAHLSAAPA